MPNNITYALYVKYSYRRALLCKHKLVGNSACLSCLLNNQRKDTMQKPTLLTTPGYGETMLKALHYSQALKVGDRIETSGQGGWDDNLKIPNCIEEEIAQAFLNVERTLATAGANWEHVVHVNSYHVGGFPPIVNETMTKLFRHYMPNRAPIWTEVGVESLGLPEMRIEIRVTAITA